MDDLDPFADDDLPPLIDDDEEIAEMRAAVARMRSRAKLLASKADVLEDFARLSDRVQWFEGLKREKNER